MTSAQRLFELDPRHVACPYPAFAEMQRAAPVAWYDDLEAFAVTGYDLILEVLREPESYSSRSATGPAADRRMMEMMLAAMEEDAELGALAGRLLAQPNATVLLQADPPDHPRQRALVNRSFTPAAIRALSPDIEVVTDGLIDGFVDRGAVELVSEFAIPLPMTMIARAVGVSPDRVEDFMQWSRTLVAVIGKGDIEREELPGFLQARSAMVGYLHSVVTEREADPRDDLISQLVASEIDGERLSHAEVISMVVQFMLAGNHTTAMLIAAAALHLASAPATATRLREDPGLVQPFLEEVLRTSPPINGTYRIALVDQVLGGIDIPAGSALWLVYAGANRDPAHFDVPDEFHWPNEAKTPHLAFGFGAHYCLGAALARSEAAIAVKALLRRLDDIRLDVEPHAIQYEHSFMLHGMQALPLRFSASTGGDRR